VYQAEPLLTLIKTVGHSHVGLALDTWNWIVGDGALDQIRELKGDDIVCVRLADLPDDVSPENAKETDRLLPGTSENSNAVDVVKHLKESGYDGPVAVNPHSTQFSGVTRDNIVQQASSALDRIFEAAGVVAVTAGATESKSLHPNMDDGPAAKETAAKETPESATSA
jgi:sugar phosphate isomerase/epimerase